MKKAQIKLDLTDDSAEIFGKHIYLNQTSSGHYCVPINSDVKVEEVNAVKIDSLSDKEKWHTLRKLH